MEEEYTTIAKGNRVQLDQLEKKLRLTQHDLIVTSWILGPGWDIRTTLEIP